MLSVEAILKEELARLREAEKSYRKALGALPKGSIQLKNIKGKAYPYLMFRSGRKVISRYLGTLSAEAREKLSKDIELRHKEEGMLRQAQRSMRRIKRMLDGRTHAA
jgi:hypothetical protein